MVPRILSTILLIVSLAGLAKAQELSGDVAEKVKKEIIELEHEKEQALTKGGTAAADFHIRHDADDMLTPSGNGGVMTKAEDVAQWQAGERKTLSMHHHDYRVRVYGDGNVVVVNYLGEDSVQIKDKVTTHQARTTEVYIKQDGVWRTLVHDVYVIQDK